MGVSFFVENFSFISLSLSFLSWRNADELVGLRVGSLRMMTNDEEFEKLRLDRKNFSSGYDYRSGCESSL